MKLTETTVEELHAAVQTTHSHRFNVLVFVAAAEQRSIVYFVFCTSQHSQLQLLFPARFTTTTSRQELAAADQDSLHCGHSKV